MVSDVMLQPLSPKSYGFFHVGCLVLFGVSGWIAVLLLTYRPMTDIGGWSFDWVLVSCCGLIVSARFCAYRVYRRVRIALDSAFFMVAFFLVGMVPASGLVLLILTADGIIRLMRGVGAVRPGQAPLRYVLAQVFFCGGSPALSMIGLGMVMGDPSQHAYSDLHVIWSLLLGSIVFVVVHYALTGLIWGLQGDSWQQVKAFVSRSVLAELALLPLSVAMVLGYRHQGLLLLCLVGISGLMLNVIFRRVVVVTDSLQARVGELSTLNDVSKIISSSLEHDVLLHNIAKATLALVKHMSLFQIALLEKETGRICYEIFSASGQRLDSHTKDCAEGLIAWVITHRQPLRLDDVNKQAVAFVSGTDEVPVRYRSWLGVPLWIYDSVVGIMVVQSEQPYAYTDDHLRVMSNIADQAAVALENVNLYELATLDGLTELYVRRYFDKRLEEEWDRAHRYGNAFALGMLDLDNFKDLNDSYGHPVGDQVLHGMAQIVRRNMRSFDVPARYGGEEFAVILPRTQLHDAVGVFERIRHDIACSSIDTRVGPLHISASIGLVCSLQVVGDSGTELVRCADEALYQAKRLGKNRVWVYAAKGMNHASG